MTSRVMTTTGAVAGIHLALILWVGVSLSRIAGVDAPAAVMQMVDVVQDRIESPARTVPPVTRTVTKAGISKSKEILSEAVAPPAAPVPASQASTEPVRAESPAPLPILPARFDADYLDNPRPAYPLLSKRLGEEGRVLLRVLVTGDGRASDIAVKQTSGYTRLDVAAREAVSRWKFVPARQGDAAVESWVIVPVSFSLGS